IRFENAGGFGTNHIYIDNFDSLPPSPIITRIIRGPADAVQITFTSPEGVATDFSLEHTTALGPSAVWQSDSNAVIQPIDATTFQADTTGSGSVQFYRVAR